ncbi:hypothetical protein LJC45_03610 [Alistipes sp. OttesenSCG-928-B03]|nr:hypothetical protein [Alistipes sp. OttesenSCG-928-B03]
MAKEDTADKTDEILSEQEEEFCQLFVNGGKGYSGNRDRCYKEVFGEDYRKNVSLCSRRLLSKTPVAARVRELAQTLQAETESIAVKLQVTETLKSVMEETASSNFTDKNGISLSPAPLRAVSVNAAKALMELYPIKYAHETKLRIEGSDGNIIFNVVVPEPPPKDEG